MTSLKVTRWTLKTYIKSASFERWQRTPFLICILLLGFVHLCCHVLQKENHTCRCQREKILTFQNSRLRLVLGKKWSGVAPMSILPNGLMTCLWCFFHMKSLRAFNRLMYISGSWYFGYNHMQRSILRMIHIKWCSCPYIMADHTAISFCMFFFSLSLGQTSSEQKKTMDVGWLLWVGTITLHGGIIKVYWNSLVRNYDWRRLIWQLHWSPATWMIQSKNLFQRPRKGLLWESFITNHLLVKEFLIKFTRYCLMDTNKSPIGTTNKSIFCSTHLK